MNVEVIGLLDEEVYKGHEQIRRIYSVYGLCPTITANTGGGHTPKIMVVKDERRSYD